ncbi:hypothetical protein N7510_003244 [Penicillium lagena]|uniref:uncharacterized protein n=1 Tax=Penicillium lagena TaxID=94218 RepID=UPI00253FB148|nr:uncharacterized protein N7510_003244 [Penicillium lagena]KAJ5619260.1 hypothetical protein N7510_003244 [Penicillium lagena]
MSPNMNTLLCLLLAVGPAAVLSAPQTQGLAMPGSTGSSGLGSGLIPGSSSSGSSLPGLGGASDSATPATGTSEEDAGSGFSAGIPGGPGVHFGAGVHKVQYGPCGPGYSEAKHAGSGFRVGIPGGPGVSFGAHADEAHQAIPCPEQPSPVIVTPIIIPSTTPAPAYVAPPAPVHSTPLISHPAPSAKPPMPVYNAGSSLVPGSGVLAVALPIILGLF